MLTLILPSDIVTRLEQALVKAGSREVGGILMAEHTDENEFLVRDITIHRRGTLASFVRRIEEAMAALNRFFARTKREYKRFNYIGEWHSHPLFEPVPSARDHQSMLDIISDAVVGANFVVLVVLRISPKGTLVGTAHSYLPNGTAHRSELTIQREGHGHR
jgi:integrative and conjugative element protein (TIGR02256 family)